MQLTSPSNNVCRRTDPFCYQHIKPSLAHQHCQHSDIEQKQGKRYAMSVITKACSTYQFDQLDIVHAFLPSQSQPNSSMQPPYRAFYLAMISGRASRMLAGRALRFLGRPISPGGREMASPCSSTLLALPMVALTPVLASPKPVLAIAFTQFCSHTLECNSS